MSDLVAAVLAVATCVLSVVLWQMYHSHRESVSTFRQIIQSLLPKDQDDGADDDDESV